MLLRYLNLVPRKISAVKAVCSTSFAKQTTLQSSTSVTHFSPNNNKVYMKLGIAHQGCFCALFRGISRAPATSKTNLFVTSLNGFQLLTNVIKNPILDVAVVLDMPLMGALDKNCHRNLFKKGFWNLWSNSLKKAVKDSFWSKRTSSVFFQHIITYSRTLFFIVCSRIPFNKKLYHLESGQFICICIDWLLWDTIFTGSYFPAYCNFAFQWLLLSVNENYGELAELFKLSAKDRSSHRRCSVRKGVLRSLRSAMLLK